VETPVFMPVGTAGAVKAILQRDLRELGASIVLANTYHMMLRPGDALVAERGGLHGFTGWNAPFLTDSGGYQVFSLAALRQISEEGVRFQSHLDGSAHLLSPERSIEIQTNLGADVIMAFDECPPSTAPREAVAAATERTTRWAERSRAAHRRGDQWLFGIVQGGLDRELRERSARQLLALDFPGYAIGGLAVGEQKPDRERVLDRECHRAAQGEQASGPEVQEVLREACLDEPLEQVLEGRIEERDERAPDHGRDPDGNQPRTLPVQGLAEDAQVHASLPGDSASSPA